MLNYDEERPHDEMIGMKQIIPQIRTKKIERNFAFDIPSIFTSGVELAP